MVDQINVGGISVDVVFKNIKNVPLERLSSEWQVRITASLEYVIVHELGRLLILQRKVENGKSQNLIYHLIRTAF